MAYANPLPANPPSSWGRTDMGVDLTLADDFRAIAVGRVLVSNVSDAGWKGGGYMAVSIDDGPRAGSVYYVAEGIRPYRPVGFQVQPGWGICSRVPSPYNGIVGNCETGWANPSSPTVPLAAPEYTYDGKVTTTGLDYRTFLTGLASGTVTGGGPALPPASVSLDPITSAITGASMYLAIRPGADNAAGRAHGGYLASKLTWDSFGGLHTFDKKGGH